MVMYMKKTMPRVLFAAPKSGSGKTMLVCGMIEVWKRKGYRVASFKCGPDYIDPMFHRRVLGISSGNLDTFFTDDDTTRYILEDKAKHADITVLEGVMGYYDGLGGQSERASSYDVAVITKTPVVLVVDGKGASVSLAALINGLVTFRRNSQICGVILNRVSSGYYDRLKRVIERECHIEVLGFLPELKDLKVPSRHLGLVSPQEIEQFEQWTGQIADAIEQYVATDRIYEIAGGAAYCEGKRPKIPQLPRRVRIGVARDEAFSFYYTENLELLEKMGAEVMTFSPLHDHKLPDKLDGIVLGGGYPERYARQLEQNREMRDDIRSVCEKKLPCLAECGGFLYLQQELEGEDGYKANMAGVLSGKGFRTERLCRFGYVTLENQTEGMFGKTGQTIRGHEFHYWDCTENGTDFEAGKPLSQIEYPVMVHTPSMVAGFPHLYYYSNVNMIYHFMLTCSRYQAIREKKEAEMQERGVV